MITRYEREILNSLLDKYEKSKSFTGTNKIDQSFKVRISRLYPKYDDHSEYELFKNINEAVEILSRKGFIKACNNTGKEVESVTLKIENIEEIYEYIRRIPKNEVNRKLIRIFKAYKEENEVLRAYCSEQMDRISRNLSVKYFSGDFQELKNILEAIKAIINTEDEQFIREFSMKVFKDSKAFGRIQNKVENILFDYGDFPERQGILGNFNLVKTPSYLNFKGAGQMILSGGTIDFSLLKGDIAISSAILDDISEIKVKSDMVITVENLTSFHTMNEDRAFIIYLGGFHNRVRREFIRMLYKQNPQVKYFHFGDIDAGGFYILKHLKEKTGVEFKPYKMDIHTIKEYINYTKPLTDNDRDRLRNLLESDYSETVQFMLENNCKLEQEAITFKKKRV